MNNNIISWIFTAVVFGTIILIGAIGETLTEKGGHLNLGVPGIMYISGFVAYYTAFSLEKATNPNGFLCVVLPIITCLLTGAIFGLLYSFMCVTLKCNQNVMGLALTTFGVGFGKFLCQALKVKDTRLDLTGRIFTHGLPGLRNIPYLGDVLYNYGFIVYLIVIIAILLHLFLTRTKTGMNLTAVGEDPATADAVGINVTLYKYLSTVIGCALAGLGGLVYVFVLSNGLWSTTNDIEAIGWLAVALVIFASWKPMHLIWGSYIFGLFFWAYTYIPAIFHISTVRGVSELLKMLPYIFTLIILIINSLRKKRENQPPKSLGLSYFREDR